MFVGRVRVFIPSRYVVFYPQIGKILFTSNIEITKVGEYAGRAHNNKGHARNCFSGIIGRRPLRELNAVRTDEPCFENRDISDFGIIVYIADRQSALVGIQGNIRNFTFCVVIDILQSKVLWIYVFPANHPTRRFCLAAATVTPCDKTSWTCFFHKLRISRCRLDRFALFLALLSVPHQFGEFVAQRTDVFSASCCNSCLIKEFGGTP
mmetsp:Transcript_13014/g.32854  ORF Transcript_13014/g.32854 Transcript_13014/m.32854 type:complete len:208 (-) Transcript_13014:75-698(-)